MSDLSVLVLCTAVCAGAFAAVEVPLVLGLLIGASGLLLRRPLVLVGGAGLLATSLAAASWAGLEAPPPVPVAGVATLLGDPADAFGAVRVDVRIGDRRMEAWARGGAADALRPRLSGELVRVRGRARPVPPTSRDRLAVRHVGSRLTIEAVGPWRPGSPATRAANGLRRTLGRGAAGLSPDDRSLLLGVVLGDDREQSEELRDAFRGSGLSHLLAVSGQNVAFVLVLAGSLLRRLDLWPRWLATLAVIAFFGLLTRWEPSVLRAGAMAALACTTATMGRPTGRLRLLALAVTGVVLVDPMLVRSVGFLLSAGATVGICLFAAPLQSRLPGPRWLRESLAVTIAAQIGVAPVAIPVFGGIPLASLPANLLAVPVAAPLTTWGFTSGLLAGVAGPPFAGWLHLPTRVLAGWLAGVARWGEGLPLGEVRAPHAVLLLVAAIAVALVRRGRRAPVGSRRWSWPWDRTASTSAPGRS